MVELMHRAGVCSLLPRGCDGLSPDCTTTGWVSQFEVLSAAGKKKPGFN